MYLFMKIFFRTPLKTGLWGPEFIRALLLVTQYKIVLRNQRNTMVHYILGKLLKAINDENREIIIQSIVYEEIKYYVLSKNKPFKKWHIYLEI